MISIINSTRNPLPRGFFSSAAEKVLGARYDLSVVILTPAKMKALNSTYRTKDTSTDILAFPLEKNAGEILISLPDVTKKAPMFGMKPHAYLKYLFVHGLVHLKGYDHGRKMDALEKKYCEKLKIEYPG